MVFDTTKKVGGVFMLYDTKSRVFWFYKTLLIGLYIYIYKYSSFKYFFNEFYNIEELRNLIIWKSDWRIMRSMRMSFYNYLYMLYENRFSIMFVYIKNDMQTTICIF